MLGSRHNDEFMQINFFKNADGEYDGPQPAHHHHNKHGSHDKHVHIHHHKHHDENLVPKTPKHHRKHDKKNEDDLFVGQV